MGSHCASKKAGFSGRQCCGLYLYPSSCPVAELFTITNSRRTRCLPEGPFSHGVYSPFLRGDLSIHIFLWKQKRKKEKKKSKQSWWAQFSGAKAKECISSNHKRRPLPSSLQPGLCLGNRRGPHNTTQGNLLIPGFRFRLLGGKIQSKKRREAFHRPQNLTRIEF